LFYLCFKVKSHTAGIERSIEWEGDEDEPRDEWAEDGEDEGEDQDD